MSEGQVTYTCVVTVVEPGLPDRVIKISPAEHEKEKIWLDTQPGRERWEAVKRLMQNYCPKGRYVPEAAYWHTPGARPEDINTPTLTADKIPSVQLDGAVFEAPPAKERVKYTNPQKSQQDALDRQAALEAKVEKLTDMLVNMASARTAPAPVVEAQQEEAPAKRGRPKKSQEDK